MNYKGVTLDCGYRLDVVVEEKLVLGAGCSATTKCSLRDPEFNAKSQRRKDAKQREEDDARSLLQAIDYPTDALSHLPLAEVHHEHKFEIAEAEIGKGLRLE